MPCLEVHRRQAFPHIFTDAAAAPKKRFIVNDARAHDATLTGQHLEQPRPALARRKLFYRLDKSAPPVGDDDIIHNQVV